MRFHNQWYDSGAEGEATTACSGFHGELIGMSTHAMYGAGKF